MTFIYKEPIQLLISTIENIAKMKRSEEIIMLVGFEEKTPDLEEKI